VLRRLACASDGQALSEYGIILAMLAGLRWLEDVGRGIADDPRLLWGLGILLVLAVGSSLRRR
jgi:hypothetical protein